MRTNTMFTKQSILGKPHSSSFKLKLYFVTPFSKSSVLPKVNKTNALSKPVTSNLAPSTRELKVVQTVNVIAPRIFRSNPSKTSKSKNTAKTRRPHPRNNSNTNRVLSKSKSSCLSNNVEKIKENHRNFQIPKNQKHVSSKCNNITLAIRNAKSEIVCVMFSIRENQKNHKANAKKSKELGSKGSLALSRPSKPRTCLRWIPTGRIFAICGKLTASSNTENKSEKSVCDNASTSNPSKPSSKGFSKSASLLGRLSRLRKQHKRQQQQDLTSSTSTLATTITADGNFDFQNRRDLPRNTPLDRVEVLVLVKEKPKTVRARQKSYGDYRRKLLEFEVGDRVLLKVAPWKGVVRFGKKGKLALRYVGPFEILERIGLCLTDTNLHVPLDELKVDKTLRFVEEPIEIIDREIKKLKHKKISLVKVRWNSKRGPEFTWEHEDQTRIRSLSNHLEDVEVRKSG
ncbi:hypothetical protein Tco_0846023 [Tanacetum coccineum]